jgi:hypothetical protein
LRFLFSGRLFVDFRARLYRGRRRQTFLWRIELLRRGFER